MKALPLAATVLALTLTTGVASAATKNITITGSVTRYGTTSPSGEVSVGAGFTVTVTLTQYTQTGNSYSKWCVPSTTTLTGVTNSAGVYSIPATITSGQCQEGSFDGDDGRWYWDPPIQELDIAVGPRTTDSNAATLSVTSATAGAAYSVNLQRTAEFSYGGLWARRIGTGANPIFFLEGFDPSDSIKVSSAACPAGVPASVCAGVSELLYVSPLPSGIDGLPKCGVGSFDGANCYVRDIPAGTTGFAYNNNLYLSPYRNVCPTGWYDGANCATNAQAPTGTTAFASGSSVYYDSLSSTCPVGSFVTYWSPIPLRARCLLGTAPSGSPGAFVWNNSFYYTPLVNTTTPCPSGSSWDGANCFVASPAPNSAGVQAFVYANKLYFSPHQPNFWTYLQNKGYSFWVISTGGVSGQSMRDTGGGDTTGLVYRAMKLVKTVYDAKHAGKRFAIGGFSMGGLLAQIGTGKWCDGAWANAGLPAGCDNLELVFFGDSPRGHGAQLPLALQAYLRHLAPYKAASLDYPSASELIAKWIPTSKNYTDGSGDQCKTRCKSAWQVFDDCESTDGNFMKNGCSTDANPRNNLLAWAGPYAGGSAVGPKRNGVYIPTVAWSHGRKPGLYGSNCGYAWDKPIFWDTNVDTNFLGIHVHHKLHLNSGPGWGWVDECQSGSGYPFKEEFDGTSMSVDGMSASFSVPFNPTFIPSASALVNSGLLRDYWYNDSTNGSHVPYSGLPAQATRMLAGYLSEFLHGRRDKPVCDTGSTTGFGWKQRDEGIVTCRAPIAETCNGLDDDGDDLIDEGLNCPIDVVIASTK